MFIKSYIDKFDNMKVENKLLKFVVLTIGCAAAVSAWYSYRAVSFQKVIILPPAIDKRIVIHGTEVSNEYLELFTKYALNLMLNYTPKIYEDQIDDLLRLTSPRYFASMEKKLNHMKDSVMELNVTSVFYPQVMKVNRTENEIQVLGLRVQTAQGQEIERQERIYILKYRMIDGRFYVDGIEEDN